MEKKISYNPSSTYLSELEVKDIFFTNIEAKDSDGNLYYVCVNTKHGVTSIIEFGPVKEKDWLYNSFKISFSQFECKPGIIANTLKRFLGPKKINGYMKNIEEAREVELETVMEMLPDIGSYLNDNFRKEDLIINE